MPKINSFTPEQQAILNRLWPTMEKLVRDVTNEGEELCFTGFLYGGDSEHPMLVHLSNIVDRGEKLVTIHYSLAMMAAALEQDKSHYEQLRIDPAPTPLLSEEIADKMALRLMAMPLNEESSDLKELLQQYLASRARK